MKSVISTGKVCPPPYIPAGEKMDLQELQGAYDDLAEAYESRMWFDQTILGVARGRRRLMSQAQGRILDVACGTGLNFPMFPTSSEVIAIDLSPRMLQMAQQKAKALHLNVQTRLMDAQQLEFPSSSFDTVTSSLSTCTFPDPVEALKEMKRVCREGGRILLLEHGHSSVRWLANFQDRNVLKHYRQSAGCRWNQDPLDLVHAAGLTVLNSRRFGLGMFHTIVAA